VSAEGDSSEILYGPHQRGDVPSPFSGLASLDMSLRPQDCRNLLSELDKIQQVIDRMTGWDKIRTESFLPFLYPDHPEHDEQTMNVDIARARRQWQRCVTLRWEIGILKTHVDDVYPAREQNTSWSVCNRPYQFKSHSYQQSEKLFIGDTLGEVLGLTYAAISGKKDFSSRATGSRNADLGQLVLEVEDQELMPPGLYSYLDEILDDRAD